MSNSVVRTDEMEYNMLIEEIDRVLNLAFKGVE